MVDLYSNLSLRMKVVVPVVALLGLLFIVLWFYISGQAGQHAENRIPGEAHILAEASCAQLSDLMNSKDAAAIQIFIDEIDGVHDLRYIVVADESGIMASYNLEDARSSSYDREEIPREGIYKISAPVTSGRSTIGHFYAGFTYEGVRSEISSIRMHTAVACLFFFLATSVLVVVLGMGLVKPVQVVLKVAEAGAAGNIRERMPGLFNDEIGKLGHAVDTMLRNAEAALARADGLSRIVEKRDQQLKHQLDEREMIEKQIQLSDEIINKVSALIIVSNNSGGIEYASPSFELVLGYKPEDLLADGWWKIVKGDVIERLKEKSHAAKCARGEQRVPEMPYERQIIDARGKLRWILWQDTPGLNYTLIGVGQDITERKMAEEQIREQAALLDITGDAIIVRNLDHRILYWNNGAERLYGWPTPDAIGKVAHELFQQESAAGIGIAYSNVVENGAWSGELKQVRKDGRVIVVESRWTLMNDENGKPKSILVVNTDVTEQRQLESQFRRAQRLENIGTLAGGIAHDLNNVLTPILMSIQAIKKWHTDEKTQQLLSTIDLSARRGADIVKQVLTFARGSEGERSLLQPKHILREIEKITRETFPRSIDIQPSIASNLWTITGDATQLHQIILNLLVNARDAMPDGGTLYLKAENVVLDEAKARGTLNAKEGSYVCFAVKDTGTGIPPEVMDKIFDPFFTTKEVGKGTGLGLSTVSAIVKSYSGFINVSSVMGQGTEFSVFIPATNTEQKLQTEEGRFHLPSGRGETILVVDDELSIREITKETLEAYGYHIETAKDGIEALTLIERDKNKYHLVLTDMMMPNMDGGSLIRTLVRLAPQIKIIAVSGITDQDVLDKIKNSRIEAFIPKPIQTDNLLKILDSVLHSDEAQTTK